MVDEDDHATLGDYTITNATLSIEEIKGNVDAGVTITYDANPYDWIKAIEDQTRASLITYKGLNGVNLDNNNVVWTITKKNSTDTVSGTTTNAFTQATYVVTVSADNHTATTGVEVVVEIEKAVLTISVNFNTGSDRIYYGEELPTVDMEGYDDLSTAIYNIVGLKGSDTPNVISGSFTFASSDYEVWDAVGSYTTTIDVSNLTSTNYTFEAAEGTITVIRLPLTITLPSLTNVYIQDVAAMEATDSLVVEAFADLYDKLTVAIGNAAKDRVSKYLQDGYTIVDIVNLMTDALIQDVDGNITATNDVDAYPFYLIAADGDLYSNYNITVSTTANSLTVPTGAVNNKTAAFTITAAENKFTDVFGFAGIDPLTTTVEGIIAAWVYGVNDEDGYNTTTHQINLPVTKFNSVPGSANINDAIVYKLYYLSGSDWIQLGVDSQDIEALFAEQLAAGNFNATSYKVEYSLEGNDNYSDVSDVRYFEVTPRDLYVWAKDAKTYYGEDFVRDVLTSGLVDNGSGTTDTLAEVATLEYVHTYVAGTTNAGKAYYTLQEKTQEEKYNNYILHWNFNDEDAEEVSGEIDVLPRPVVITIASKTSQYNFNNKPGVGETLSFTAQLGTNELGIEFASNNPFYGNAKTQFNNDSADNNYVTLSTNALLDGDIKTQNVGNYAIFALYKNDLAKQNYAITIATEYSRNEALEDEVNAYFTTEASTYNFYDTYIEGYYDEILSDLMISIKDGENYKAGTYKIISSNLTLTMTLPDPTYNGNGKAVTLNGDVPSDPFGLVSFKAQYDYNYGKEESLYLDEAPVNVGTYPVRVVVQNPNYSFDAGGLANAVKITKRELDWNASINEANNLSKATAYGDATTMYLGAGNANQLDIKFNNIFTNSSVTEESGLDARLKFIMTISGKAISGTSIAAAYGDDFVLYDYDIDAATYTLLAQHSGIYTVTLKLDGTEAQNYNFPSAYLKAGTTDTYEFTFTIRRSDKASVVSAQNTQVQYGTPITANGSTTNPDLFGGFKLDTATLALIAAENDQLAGTSDASKVTYKATHALNQSMNYDPATAAARTNYQVQPDGLWFYNYDVRYNRNAVMTVNPREIVVVIAGAESNNTYASVVYSGELQGPDHSEVAASQKYFVPQDLEGGIKWYGEAVADKNKNYADLFNYYLNLFAGANTGVNGGKGLEADTYYIKVNGTGLTNYSVTFQNKAGDELTTTDAAIETAPTYVIQKKKLQVQVGSTGLNNTDAFATSFTIPYGNTLIKTEDTYYYLTAEYYGLVDRDNTTDFINAANAKLKFTTHKASGNGTEAYVPWDSHAGSKYTIRPVEFDFDNYEVTDWLTATMEIVSRLVTATTENRTYTEYRDNGVINYQQGRQGAYHAAQIVFADYDSSLYNTNGTAKYYTDEIQKDAYGVILSGIITSYAPKYTVSYVNADNSSEAISAQGPRMVGKYNATVSMASNNGNYDYMVVSQGSTSGSSSTTLSYAVNKKKLTIRWNTVDSDYLNFNTGDDKQREILDFIAEIMSVNQITRQFTNTLTNEQDVEYISEALGLADFGDQSYYIDSTNTKVLIKIYGIGLYTATISISSNAVRNYEWRDASGASGTEFTLAFRVATDSITIDSLFLDLGVWSYGEKTPDVHFSTNVSGVGLLYKYAAINSIPDTYEYTLGTMIEDHSLTQYLDLHNSGYSMTMPTDAGLYVMCAWYPGSDQYQMSDAFLVFEIEKAVLQTPDLINSELEFKEENGKKVIEMTYTGNVLQLELGYDTKLLDINYAGSMSAPTSGKGMILLATDVTEEGYAVSFSLSDQANYAWDLESFGEFVWKVIPAEDNTIESFDFDELLAGLTYGESYSDPTASATYSNDIIIEYFVNDVWGTTKPDQAGTYKVRAVSPATKNYYSGSKDQPAISDEVTFTIEKKELYVKASGSMTYGDEFSVIGGNAYNYQFTGFINNDTATKVTVDHIEYKLNDAPAKLVVGDYKIQLVEVEGEVIGMTADNYKIIAEEGDFTVNKKDVMVVLGVASSVYGEKVDLSKVSMNVIGNQLVPGDDIKDLNIQLSINSTGFDLESIYNPAASYKVDAEGQETSKNYNVTVYGSGVYTITPLSIYITVEAGGGVFQGTITPVKLTGIYTTDGNKNVLEMFDEAHAPKIRFNYWGSSNDGNWSHTNAEMWSAEPTLAGNYYATAISTQTNDYTLVTNMGTPSVSFVVEKKTLDDTNREVLFANPMEYTGSVVTPVITDLAFEGLYNTGATNYETVGVYTIPLTLKDSANYKWASVDSATCEVPFEIIRSNNAFEGEVSIQDWVYGKYDAVKNLPTANIKFGTSDDFTFSYSDKEDGTYTANIPTNAGTYWVKITAPQTDNYYSVTSDAKQFHITKATVTAPTLVMVSDGDNQNTIYTGSRLQAEINGYNSSTMRMVYDGDSSFGNSVAVFGLNADTYVVKFVLNDSDNYAWADGTTLVEGDATLYWSVARKQIAKPTMNTNSFMVNGSTLTFIPVGFDEETMNIEGNKTSYGGSFKVTVSIKDKTNFEWADSTTEDVVFDWFVVGWDTVFAIVLSVLGVVAGIAAIAIVIQYVLHRRKKKRELDDELAAQGLFDENMDLMKENATSAKEPIDGGNNNE
ncbi:MAG: hypothetical protein K2O23_03945 [Anaeroplasmataceae bacterium]|nr:hypothetical protein [Anaeroplasmataceae bacterium]